MIHHQCLFLAQMILVMQDVQMVLAGAFVKQVLPAKALVIRILIVDITYIDILKVHSFPNIHFNIKTIISNIRIILF